MKTRHLFIAFLIILYSCSGNVIQTTVFHDGFEDMETGVIHMSSSVDPAIYFIPGSGSSGSWSVATSLRQDDFNRAWSVEEENGRMVLKQSFSNLDLLNEPLSLVTHPMIVAGDTLWKDFKIEVDFTPHANFDKCGIIFAYQHPNEFYFFGTEGNTITLKHIQQSVTPLRPIERILAYRPMVWTPGEEMRAILTVRRNKISTILNDTIRMYEGAEVLQPGRIGLISDLPASFHRVEVELLKGDLRQLNRKKRQLERKREIHLKGHPGMVRWKSLDLTGLGADQNLRLGDLTGDGNKELLFASSGASGEDICCVSAMNLGGELIWQYGNKNRIRASKGKELAVQIHDLDGDRQREVIFISKGNIYSLDGKSGKVIRRVRLPSSFNPGSMIFGDLQGVGRDNCMILTDRKSRLMVYNEKLDLLWEQKIENGSHPLCFDMDGDNRDEVLVGYRAYHPDGNLRFDAGEFIGDGCNGILPYELRDGDRLLPCILYAAGDWGALYVDYEGNILKQVILGHVKYMSAANFNMETPGLELVTSNHWGSDGLVHILNDKGDIVKNFMPFAGVSRCQPVNWKGDGEEFFILNADTLTGGMYDRNGALSVSFLSDDHPLTTYLAADLYGDVRDEVLVWDESQLWIYTQDDNPRMGKTYHPERSSFYNHSLLQMNLSKEGW